MISLIFILALMLRRRGGFLIYEQRVLGGEGLRRVALRPYFSQTGSIHLFILTGLVSV